MGKKNKSAWEDLKGIAAYDFEHSKSKIVNTLLRCTNKMSVTEDADKR